MKKKSLFQFVIVSVSTLFVLSQPAFSHMEHSAPAMPKSVVTDDHFSWGADRKPRTPWPDTVIYEAHVRGLTMLRHDSRVVLRYVDNPNGSLDDIAGICSEKRNVMGMMPHPERAADALLGCTDGKVILESMIHSLSVAAA